MAVKNVNELKQEINELIAASKRQDYTVDQRKNHFAQAYAYWVLIEKSNNAENINLDENVDQYNAAFNRAANSYLFKVSERTGKINDLTSIPIASLTQRIESVENDVFRCAEGNEESCNKADNIYQQLNRTWRIKWNSSEFNKAKQAMRDIATLGENPSQLDYYLASDPVSKYITKNLNKAKSAVGMTRMACSLAFMKQTMSKNDFKLYCKNLNHARHIPYIQNGDEIVFDVTSPRAIVPEEIGTIQEVYNEAKERIHQYMISDEKINPRDLAKFAALRNLQKKFPADGENHIVEHEALQAEIEKVQNDLRFQEMFRSHRRDEALYKAWAGNLDSVENYTKPLDAYWQSELNKSREEAAQKEQQKEEVLKLLEEERQAKAKIDEELKKQEEENQRKKLEQEKLLKKQKELEEFNKTNRLMVDLYKDLVPQVKNIAKPVQDKKDAEKKQAEEEKNDPINNIFKIINDDGNKKEDPTWIDKLFNDELEDPFEKNLELLATLVTVGHIGKKLKEERSKDPSLKKTEPSVKLSEFKNSVDTLKKNPLFVSFAKQYINSPEFSEHAYNHLEKFRNSKDMDPERQEITAVRAFAENLNGAVEKYMTMNKKRSTDELYRSLNDDLQVFTNPAAFNRKKEVVNAPAEKKEDIKNKLKKIYIGNILAIREIQDEKGPDAKASYEEINQLTAKYARNPALDIVIQSLNGPVLQGKLNKISSQKNYAQQFGKIINEHFDKAVETTKRLKQNAEKNNFQK